MKKPQDIEVVIDSALLRQLDEWLACKSRSEALWLEIKAYIAGNRLTRNQVRYMLAEKGIAEGRGKPPLFDPQPRKKRPENMTSLYRLEKEMILAARFAIQRGGISSPTFVALAEKTFKIARRDARR